jgi:hypothetical protein
MIYSGTHSLTLREDKDTRLSIQEMDNNLKFLNNLALSATPQESYRLLTISDFYENSCLVSTTDTYLFIDCPFNAYLSLYLPTPAEMPGKKLVFIKTDNHYENYVALHGTFNNESIYHLNNSGQNATFVSDGNTWWLIAGSF